jgi:hypothetical protein
MATGVVDAGILKGGRLSKSVAGAANVTLTQAEWENRHQEYTGVLTGSIQVILPLQAGMEWVIYNGTSGAFTLTVIGASGTGVLVTQGKRTIVYCDGTNINAVVSDVSALVIQGEAQIGGALNHDGSTVGFYGVTPTARPSAYTLTNVTPDRGYDADATTTDELADVLGTVIADLKLQGLLQ